MGSHRIVIGDVTRFSVFSPHLAICICMAGIFIVVKISIKTWMVWEFGLLSALHNSSKETLHSIWYFNLFSSAPYNASSNLHWYGNIWIDDRHKWCHLNLGSIGQSQNRNRWCHFQVFQFKLGLRGVSMPWNYCKTDRADWVAKQ